MPTRYLSDNWVPVIEKDVDGPAALPGRIDSEVPNLGKYQATRRVALASFGGVTAAHKGEHFVHRNLLVKEVGAHRKTQIIVFLGIYGQNQ